jgi:hypothetical protein
LPRLGSGQEIRVCGMNEYERTDTIKVIKVQGVQCASGASAVTEGNVSTLVECSESSLFIHGVQIFVNNTFWRIFTIR